MISTSSNDQKYPRYPLVIKSNVILARPLRLLILYFLNGKSCQMIACIFITANETRPYKTIAKFIVHSIDGTVFDKCKSNMNSRLLWSAGQVTTG